MASAKTDFTCETALIYPTDLTDTRERLTFFRDDGREFPLVDIYLGRSAVSRSYAESFGPYREEDFSSKLKQRISKPKSPKIEMSIATNDRTQVVKTARAIADAIFNISDVTDENIESIEE
jgi:hypothetical protein